jgi:glycosyltransferase involved in cell wall biosynthesis
VTDVAPASRSPVAQRIALVLPSTGEFDSRAERLAASLAERGHAVTVLARWAPDLARAEVRGRIRIVRVPVSAADGAPGAARLHRLLAGVRPIRVWLETRSQGRAIRQVAPEVDVVHAMAFLGLAASRWLRIRRPRPRIVFDARDIYAEARNIARLPRPARWLFRAIERRWARAAAAIVTTNEAYAEVMRARFGRPIVVVMNAPRASDQPALGGRRFHEALSLPTTAQVVLYHGGLDRDRGIEVLLDAVPDLPPEAVVVLMGYGPLEPMLRERMTATKDPRWHLLPAVPPAELLAWVASADVVAIPIQPTSLNHLLTTPNKLFEALAAGVPVVAADLPGIAAIVRETGIGVLCDPTSPSAVAEAVREVLAWDAATRATIRQRARAAVRERYSWEAQVTGLLDAYGRITGQAW